MRKVYEKMHILPGDKIEDVVNKLLSHQENEQLHYCVFNGVSLYSDTVTLDDAFLKITGKTYEEIKALEAEINNY